MKTKKNINSTLNISKWAIYLFSICMLCTQLELFANDEQSSPLIIENLPISKAPSTEDLIQAEVNSRLASFKGDNINKHIDAYNKDKFMKSSEFIICIMILVFAVATIAIQVILFVKGKLKSPVIYKLMLLTLIIFSTLFLIASGYSNDQIAPALGLLGTIAGYLLGKSSDSENETKA